MADEDSSSNLRGMYKKFKPRILMVLAQVAFTYLYFLTQASFNHGMNPHVYITKERPKLTFALFLEIFLLSFLGVGLTLNLYFASLKYTSPSFLASMINTIASFTFVIAVVLRLEVVNHRNPRGLAKVLGALVSLAGVLTMALYKGPIVRNLGHPLIQIQGKSSSHENWLKGPILTVASCITWSIWYVMQAITLKRYPAQLSLTTWMGFIGAAQSAVFTVCMEHRLAAWTIGFNIDLWVWQGAVCSGLIIFIQLWCTEKKGPVFVAMFDPISTILVAVVAYFVLSERLYTGSILGAFIGILGLYLLLWGKEGDEVYIKSKDQMTYQEQKDNNLHKVTSPHKDIHGEP